MDGQSNLKRSSHKTAVKRRRSTYSRGQLGLLIGAVALGTVSIWTMVKPTSPATSSAPDNASISRPALTVQAVHPEVMEWPTSLVANGSIAAWQESIIGAELSGLRLIEVSANVGDKVKRGQLLARLAEDSIAAEVAQQEAAVAEARAALKEAEANIQRARLLTDSGVLSAQQITQFKTAQSSTQARLVSAQARLQNEQLRLRQTRITATDDGIISASHAVVGGVVQQGQELFRLIRQDRLEWRAEINANELAKIQAGQTVKVMATNGVAVSGKVRMVAPTVDPQTRNAIVYVDLIKHDGVRPGMYASGEFELGRARALTLPQAAIMQQDSTSYAFVIGTDNKVVKTRLVLGKRVGNRVEVLQGVTPSSAVVAKGAAFLNDGDQVYVITSPAPTTLVPQISLSNSKLL